MEHLKAGELGHRMRCQGMSVASLQASRVQIDQKHI